MTLDAVGHGISLCFELMQRMSTDQEVTVDWSVSEHMGELDLEVGDRILVNTLPWKRKITTFDDIGDFAERLKEVSDFIHSDETCSCRTFWFEGFTIDETMVGCTITITWGS